ncbi:MAG: acyl-CoA dehydrogenase family protein [Burkholderiaceae bacterium]
MNARTIKALDFSDVTTEEALSRARDLVPVLRQRADQAETERSLLKDTEADLHRLGLFRFHQPRRYGGMELDFQAFVDLPAEIGRGCASTAWNVANLGAHHWMLALYDERAQDEVWGANPDALIASGIAYPQGRGRKVDGGFILSGRWNFSSGVDVSQWNMLAAIIRDGETVIDYRMCLLPASDYQVVDDWQVLGMRNTGSKTVVANEVFVPDYRALASLDARGGKGFPGAKSNPNPLYQIPMSAIGAHGLGGAAVGNAQAALELSIELVKERSTHYTQMKMRDFQAVQLRIGAAGSKIDAARLLMRNDCIEGQQFSNRGEIPDAQTKLRFKRNLAYAVSLCTEAVDLMHAMAGGNGIYDSYPIQRIFRDAHALAGHFSFSYDAQLSNWGLVALGGEATTPTL